MNCQRHLIIRKGNKALPFPTPFIPCVANLFPFLAQRFAWGEERVVFPDPQTHEVRSLPVAWTSLAPPDPFWWVPVAKPRDVFRMSSVWCSG